MSEAKNVETSPATRGSVVERFVMQENRSGCGIACVAMLCGKTYQEVKSAWLGMGGIPELLDSAGNGAGITVQDIDELLRFYEVQQDWIEAPRIVRIQQPDYDWMYHFVVIDEKGAVLDPAAIA